MTNDTETLCSRCIEYRQNLPSARRQHFKPGTIRNGSCSRCDDPTRGWEAAATDLRPATELNNRQPTMDDVKRGFRFRHSEFDCLTLRESEIMIQLPSDGGWLLVIGDPSGGSYEWAHVRCSGRSYIEPSIYVERAQDAEEWTHSNKGWGSVLSALIDGGLATEGTSCSDCGCCILPENVAIRCHRCEPLTVQQLRQNGRCRSCPECSADLIARPDGSFGRISGDSRQCPECSATLPQWSLPQ